MVDALARATPAHEPGTQNGYRALTYGWPVGEVVRRVSGQPLDRFAQSEIAEALDLEPAGTTHRPRSSEK